MSSRRTSAAILALVTGLLLSLGSAPAQAADKDCGDFASQKAAQIFFLQNGGPQQDPHRLDADGDGIACDSNPAPYYYGTTLPDSGTSTPVVKTIRQRGRVISVTDGDTIKVRLATGVRRNVRLIGIDTPEVYGGVQCGGKRASASLRQLLPLGTRVLLVSDPTQARVDRYGRLLRYVWKGTRDMNRAQVARGWAKVYVFNNKPFQRVVPYRKSQRAARANDRGIWGLCY